jgi:hypothetical protein
MQALNCIPMKWRIEMLLLSLIWLLLGALIGLLANAAKLWPVAWKTLRWVSLPGIGAITSCAGGWLGILILGKFLATGMAIWIAVLCVMLIPLIGSGRNAFFSKRP